MSRMAQGDWKLLSGHAADVAPQLLGAYLVRTIAGEQLVGRIVEVEAYDQSDAASHSYRGMTNRTAVMFGPPGHLYVYFTYGMHYCMNVATDAVGHGAGVLIRALEPIEGEERMLLHRGGRVQGVNLTNGPGKACQALKVDRTLSGHDLRTLPLQLILQPPMSPADIVQTIRVGISAARETPWRFYIRDNPYVSRPR